MSLNNNAVLSFPFNADFDDAIGSNDGTASGALIDVGVGKIENSAIFDGINDKVNVPDGADLDAVSGLTIALWVKRVVTASAGCLIAKQSSEVANNNSFYLLIESTNTVQFVVDQDGDAVSKDTLSSDVTINDTDWHFIVARWDTSNISIDIDGTTKTQASSISGIYAGASDLQVGIFRNIGVDYFPYKGNIDAVTIWKNRAITDAEVTQLWNEGDGLEMPVDVPSGLLMMGVG
jgi:hypothetical protein